MGVIGVMSLVNCLGRKTTEEDEIAGEGMIAEVSLLIIQMMATSLKIIFWTSVFCLINIQ